MDDNFFLRWLKIFAVLLFASGVIFSFVILIVKGVSALYNLSDTAGHIGVFVLCCAFLALILSAKSDPDGM